MCPLKINIHDQIFTWRRVIAERRAMPVAKRQAMKAAGRLMASPVLFRAAVEAAGAGVEYLPRLLLYQRFNAWGRQREVPAEPVANDPTTVGRGLFPADAVICSATPEVAGNRNLAAVQRPAELDDVDLGIVRAVFGVAGTGSVLLTESHLGVEALGFLAQHLVVLLDPARIVPTLHHAYRDPAFHQARYVILMTGPLATADIEGVLIHGAQGTRSLTVLPVPTPTP